MVSRRAIACNSRDVNGLDEGWRMSEIPFLAEMQRLTRNAVAMRFRVSLVWGSPLRTRCGVQPQLVAHPPDLCGGDGTMDRLEGRAQAADRTAGGKAARQTDVPIMMRIEKGHVRLPMSARRAPDDPTCEDGHRISRDPAILSHKRNISSSNARRRDRERWEHRCPDHIDDRFRGASLLRKHAAKCSATTNRGWKP